mmetsp:Transcript_51518/g.137483  ORF Transcript_51518/g.137483 Transcript_51518/m.137483 type:complete len:305 (-) Transcript_51518:260-1174(-)
MGGDTASLEVHLHPLVLINISDHFVRARASVRSSRVIGAIIGDQEGRRVDFHNSFELCMDSETELDVDFFKQRLAQYLEIFPKYEFLGWYSIGHAPQDADKELYKKVQDLTSNENPFNLYLDAEAMMAETAEGGQQSEEIPVKVFDSVTHIVDGDTLIAWSEVPYVIDTLEAERISVNHVATQGSVSVGGHTSDFTQHTGGLKNAVVMLNNRVTQLLEYMRDVKAGNTPVNHEVLRQMKCICDELKVTQPEALQAQFSGEINDAMLVVLLATLTKTCARTSDLMDKFQLAHDKKHRQRHHYSFG